MRDKLKTCPFCGSEDIKMGETGNIFGVDNYIKCCTCGGKMQICEEYGEDELIKRWNRRAGNE